MNLKRRCVRPLKISNRRGGNQPKARQLNNEMHNFTAVVEKCIETGLYVGYVPGFPGAHSQGETLDELNENLREVVAMLLEDGEPQMEAEFVGTQSIELN